MTVNLFGLAFGHDMRVSAKTQSHDDRLIIAQLNELATIWLELYVLSNQSDRRIMRSVVSLFRRLTPVVLCRFMLDLRQTEVHNKSELISTNIVFATIDVDCLTGSYDFQTEPSLDI